MSTSKNRRSFYSQLQSRLNRRRKRHLRYEHLEHRFMLAGDLDGDGVDDAIEDAGPNGGDGNNDSILDSTQGKVASLPSLATGNYATIVTDVGTLTGVSAISNPSPGNAPAGVAFPIGFFNFNVQGISPAGGPATVNIISTDTVAFSSHWLYGPTPVSAGANTWFEYTSGFDGRGGATYNGSTVTLTLIDGAAGDNDLTKNGVISARGGSGGAGAPTNPGDRVEQTQTITAVVAGNVADSDTDNDFDGDNHNDLPGPVPILASAGVAGSGGAGSNGTRRIHIEWDIAGLVSDIQGGDILTSASVLLHTNKGSVDSLDTFFYAANSDGNGTLEDSDFQIEAQVFGGVIMPVPAGPAGTTGTFSFDVTTRLQAAIDNGFDYFVIQGRVDEATLIPDIQNPPTLSQRGLQVHTTADGNITAALTPELNFVLNSGGDNDGVTDAVEAGAPNGGDGNNDGILDSTQSNVSSLRNAANGQYVTVAAAGGLQLASVNVSQPSPPAAGVELPIGVVGYALNGLASGAATVVSIFPQNPLPAGTSYYKFGPEPANTSNHWYEFTYNGTTGAQFYNSAGGLAGPADSVVRIDLHLVDGGRGDSDLSANGVILDPGGPSIANVAPNLTVANGTSTTGIGSTATNTGTFADAAGQIVMLDSSIGNVAYGEGDSGNWTWQFGPAVGSGQNQIVTITATDNFGAQSAVQFNLVVNDSLPDVLTIDPSSPITVGEGTNVTVTGTYNVGAGVAPFSGTAVWSDGVSSPLTVNTDGTFSTSRILDDTGTDVDGAVGTVNVTVTIIDASQGSDSITSAEISVTNVAPTISLTGAADVNEGSPYTLTLGTVNDPGDTVTSFSISWGDGTVDNFTGSADNAVLTHTYADGVASRQIIVSLTDEDGTHTGGDKTITVNNVAPTIGLSGAAIVNVGAIYQITLGGVVDPGNDTVTAYSINWDDGTIENFTRAVDGPPDGQTLTHTYLGPPQVATIRVTLTDEDGTFADVGTKTILVTSVPTITVDNAAVNVNEGVTATNSGTFDDLDPGDNVIVSASFGTITQDTGNSGNWSWSASNLDGPDDDQTVTITATDSTGASDSVIFTLSVNNLPPSIDTITVSSASINEAQSVSVSGTYSDPALGVPTETFTGSALWSDGVSTTLTINGDGTYSTSRDFPDDHPSSGTPSDNFTVVISINDDDGGSDSATSPTVTVNNVAPVIGSFAVAPGSKGTFANKAVENEVISVLASFTDVGVLDTHTATIAWGDGTTTNGVVTQGSGSGTVSANHAYSTGGIYTITVTILDDDTGTVSTTTTGVVIGSGIHTVNGQQVLEVVGTNGVDLVTVNKQGSSTFNIHANFFAGGEPFRTYANADVDVILILLCDGDDHLNIAGNIDEVDATIVVDGGAGNDILKGAKGRDVLIGGTGADAIHGKSGGDVLIGGSIAEDHVALVSAAAHWVSGASYGARVTAFDAAITVVDDNNTDELKGDQDQDLFFNGQGDNLQDVASNETVLPLVPASEGAGGANAFPYHNSANPADVDDSGSVSALDALMIINDLNAKGARVLSGSTEGMIDVSRDNSVTPLDALLVINVLNGSGAASEGEGAPASTPQQVSLAETPNRADAEVSSGLVGFVVTTDLTRTAVRSNAGSRLTDDLDLDTGTVRQISEPLPTASLSENTARRKAAVDADELDSELDELAEDLAGLHQITARDLFFGRLDA